MRLPDLSKQKYSRPFKFEFQIGHKIFEIYLYKNVSNLKFRFNLTSYVVSGCAGDVMVKVMARVKKALCTHQMAGEYCRCRNGDYVKHTLQNKTVSGLQIKTIYCGSLAT